MTYPANLSLVDLARHYAMYKDEQCLKELADRDSQKVFDFHKEVASSEKSADNVSVNDRRWWNEIYEEGRKVGFKQGFKEGLKEGCQGVVR